jgi:hypothetical protein
MAGTKKPAPKKPFPGAAPPFTKKTAGTGKANGYGKRK